MAIHRWPQAAAAAVLATRAANAQVFDLAGVQFPAPGSAVAAFVTTAAGRGEHVAVEGVVVGARGLVRGLSIAVLPTRGPWPELECASGRSSLTGKGATSGTVNEGLEIGDLAVNAVDAGAVIAHLDVGDVGNSETKLAAAGAWAVVVVNCGESEGSYISGGTVSVRGMRGFLPAHEEGTVNVQAGFGVAYAVLGMLWVCFTFRWAGNDMTATPLAQQAVTVLAFVCLVTTLVTIGVTSAKQQMGSVHIDVGSCAQAVRVAQVVFTLFGVAVGASCSGAQIGGLAGVPSVLAIEVALTVVSASLGPAFGLLGRRTAGTDLVGWTGASLLPAAAALVLGAAWVLRHVGRRMRELREAAVAVEGGAAAGSLLRLRVSIGLFASVALLGAAATWQAMTTSSVSYFDVVLAEQAGTAAVLVGLMATWACEVAEDRPWRGQYAPQRDVEDPTEADQVAGADKQPCAGPRAEAVGSSSKMPVQ